MSAAATIHSLKGGNAHELEVLRAMKEGAVELFDGLISEAFKRGYALGDLEEGLETDAIRYRTNNASKTESKLARSIKDLIYECEQAIDESYDQYGVAIDDAHTVYKQQLTKWTRALDEQKARKEPIYKLWKIVAKLKEDGMPELHKYALELYEEECLRLGSKEDGDSLELTSMAERREELGDQAWKTYLKEKERWEKRIATFRAIAESQGLHLED